MAGAGPAGRPPHRPSHVAAGAALRRWLAALAPAPLAIDRRERARAVLGALLGLLFTAAASRWLFHSASGAPWLLAPLGASTVLVFATPASPLAQPWSVMGGNGFSALIGIACAAVIPDAVPAAACAVALAIGLMFALRCLHPPGGAMALSAVLLHAANPAQQLSVSAALAGSGLLVVAGMAYNSLTGRRYPHSQRAPAPNATPQAQVARLDAADLDAVLARYNQVLDISRDDLEGLLQQAQTQAYRRYLGDIRCGDVMSAAVVAVEFGTPLQEAWDLMQTRGVKALPVLDRARRVEGIVTRADFLRAAGIGRHEGVRARLHAVLRPDGLSHSEKPAVVGQVMSRPARTVDKDVHAADLMSLFARTGHHHLPIVDAERRIAGMVTPSDLLRALDRGQRLAAAVPEAAA